MSLAQLVSYQRTDTLAVMTSVCNGMVKHDGVCWGWVFTGANGVQPRPQAGSAGKTVGFAAGTSPPEEEVASEEV